MAVSTQYRHTPLNLDKDEIRLCRIVKPIEQINSDQTIDIQPCVCIKHFRLSELLEEGLRYVALSYMWGENIQSHQVAIDEAGSELAVSENLYDFLITRSRKQDCSDWLWIDQICIDQSSAERNHQVRRMAEIYSSAGQVWIWLGLDNAHEADHMFDLIEQKAFSRMSPFESNTREYQELATQADPLLKHEYFSRIWILQEIYLAHELVLMWGSLRCPRISGLSKSQRMDLGWSFCMYVHDHPLFHCVPKISPDGKFGYSLTSCLDNRMTHKCTDARDKVFGIMACVDPNQRIPVDYSKTTEEVFWETCRAIFLHEIVFSAEMDLEPQNSRYHERLSRAARYPYQFLQTLLSLRHGMGLDGAVSHDEVWAQLESWTRTCSFPDREGFLREAYKYWDTSLKEKEPTSL